MEIRRSQTVVSLPVSPCRDTNRLANTATLAILLVFRVQLGILPPNLRRFIRAELRGVTVLLAFPARSSGGVQGEELVIPSVPFDGIDICTLLEDLSNNLVSFIPSARDTDTFSVFPIVGTLLYFGCQI